MTQPQGPTSADHRRFMLERFAAGSVGAEIGVHLGDFSATILEIVKPGHLHLIDPWKHEESATYEGAWYGGLAEHGQAEMDKRYEGVLARFAGEISAGRVTVHRGSSADVLSSLPDQSLDWVYIDGNHLYEYVLEDLRLSLAKVKPGGLVTGDDYVPGGWWDGGVKRAVDELAESGAARLVLLERRQYVFQNPPPG